MLDYPVEKLAHATAEACLEFCGVTDRAKGHVSLAQVGHFVETANPAAVFSPPEGNDPTKESGGDD